MKFPQKKILIFTIILMLSLILINEFFSTKKIALQKQLWQNNIEIKITGNYKNYNLIFISPYMYPYHYLSEEVLYKKINGLFESIQPYLKKNSIVIFPEEFGKWLVIANESYKIHFCKSSTCGWVRMILRKIPDFLYYYLTEDYDPIHTLFAIKNNEILQIYTNVFSKLSKKYSVSIIGGTLISFKPFIKNHLVFYNEKQKIGENFFVFSKDGLPIFTGNEYSLKLNNNFFKILISDINNDKKKEYAYIFYKEIDLKKCKDTLCFYIPFRGKIWDKEYHKPFIIESRIIDLSEENKNGKDVIFIYQK